MPTPYNVVNVDTAVVTTFPIKIAQSDGKQVIGISITRAPTGVEAFLRIGGPQADRLLIVPGRSFDLTIPERDGIFYENLAPLVGSVEFVLSYFQPCNPQGEGGLTVFN